MKELNKKGNLTDREWEELASIFSGEKDGDLPKSVNGDIDETRESWKNLSKMENEKPIDVDKAWNNVYAKISGNLSENREAPVRSIFRRYTFLRIAAAILIIVSFGAITVLVNRTGYFSKEIAVVSGDDQRNLQVDLPDGSRIFLNRNSRLTYSSDFGRNQRSVKLTGEAFFEISPDKSKPFTIDAGKAIVRVVGTSFSVLTENENSEVEVFVKTGKVLLSEKSSEKSLELDPGYIGKTESGNIGKSVNTDQNYLSWNTGMLDYKNEKLEVVFSDLKKVYNMYIIADDPSILQLPWTSPINYQPQDNIIKMICLSFGLSYTKDGNVYHLSEK
ncbi:MAG TPA: FecR family protein [Bacteroidales bacterium]|nr:FecR family protein [Bacteroidales bacterium]